MRKDVEVRLGPGDRERLEAVLADRNSAQKHAWRARIILATAAGCGTAEIMRQAGVSKPSVWPPLVTSAYQREVASSDIPQLPHRAVRRQLGRPSTGPGKPSASSDVSAARRPLRNAR